MSANTDSEIIEIVDRFLDATRELSRCQAGSTGSDALSISFELVLLRAAIQTLAIRRNDSAQVIKTLTKYREAEIEQRRQNDK